jgi:hypothetical protein
VRQDPRARLLLLLEASTTQLDGALVKRNELRQRLQRIAADLNLGTRGNCEQGWRNARDYLHMTHSEVEAVEHAAEEGGVEVGHLGVVQE